MEEQAIEPISVKILGKEYTVACPIGQEPALLQAAKFVDQEMRGIREAGKVLDNDRIAVIVALNLAHELLQQRQHSAAQATQTRIEQLETLVDEALARYASDEAS